MECLHCLGLLRHRVCLETLVVFFTVAVCRFTVGFERWNTPAPDFLPTPSNLTFYAGELAVLRCSVFNLGTKTVVWRRLDSSFPITSGTMTVVSDNRFQIGHVSYKNQWDLMIKNVQPDDEGVYECQVSSRDKTIRRLVSLTVLDKEYDNPEIQISGQQYVERGDEIWLRCNATGAYYPPKEMDWFRNGERLTSRTNKGMRISKKYSILQRTFTSDLMIDRADREDDGTYVCRSSDMQITSTKVHVLNAETFNKKRGTLNESGDDKSAAFVEAPVRSSTTTIFPAWHLTVISVSITFLVL